VEEAVEEAAEEAAVVEEALVEVQAVEVQVAARGLAVHRRQAMLAVLPDLALALPARTAVEATIPEAQPHHTLQVLDHHPASLRT
jgi:hypothetical protein